MKSVTIRGLRLGEGMPKICVPIVGQTEEDIREILNQMMSGENLPDMIEFRADWFEHIFDFERTTEVLKEIRKKAGEIPVLFTFRTAKEGGEKEIALTQYCDLLKHVAAGGLVDAVDVEVFSFDVLMDELVDELHKYQMVVIGSNHDFAKTPETEEMVNRLYQMRNCQADISKIAVMPRDIEDVYRLLGATHLASKDKEMCPIITMSMSGQGVISRLSGEVFGSVLTFASMGRASAPGQIEIDKLRMVLSVIHESM